MTGAGYQELLISSSCCRCTDGIYQANCKKKMKSSEGSLTKENRADIVQVMGNDREVMK